MENPVKRPNYLLYGFISVSLLIHLLVILHVAGIYKSRTISYIELSMQQVAGPESRKIPKPRLREKPAKVSSVKPLKARKIHIPKIKQAVIETHQMDPGLERIDIPQLPGIIADSGFSVPDLNISDQATGVEVQDAPVEFINAKDYFEMLNLRIHSVKKYPPSARSRNIEGRVNVQFTLAKDGSLLDVKVLKSSRHKKLDKAAINAIKKAAPFPRPPGFIFKTPATFRIDILFELA